jgi:predicted regulator of Ras-like GTPase activity (Roadblock/LC7/MglB family)
MDSNIENQLIRILNGLNKVEGIDSSLIADSNGSVICHNMSRRTDTSLFGPMAHVITSSSKRLLNSANQGEIQRVLVESREGKALFLHLGNTYFITLMEISANVGLVMVSAKRAAQEIIEITRDMVPVLPADEELIPVSHEETPATSQETEISEGVTIEDEAHPKSEIDKIIEDGELEQEDIKEIVDKITETGDIEEAFGKVVGSEKLDEMVESEEFKALDSEEAKEKLVEMLEIEVEDQKEATRVMESENLEISEESEITIDKADILPEIEDESKIKEVEAQEEIKESEGTLPVIRPPISFPKLPEDVRIPDGDEEKSNLVLDIYEAIFLAMSIGASKIMGVAPARGLIKRFLPLEDCKILLKDVDVKSNSAIDFDKIRENADDIPLNERENTLITDFSRIITIITENYGKVMGYGAFRGIVRTEFKIINRSYGKAMGELGIKDKIHPELVNLFG